MSTLEHDSRFLEAAFPELEAYLLAEALYWPLGGALPRLTPGALLLALRQVEVRSPTLASKWQAQLETVRMKRRTAWEQKSLKEVQSRLRLWSASVSEWQSAQAERRADYPGEVRGRVILHILLNEVNAPLEQAALASLDIFLRNSLTPTAFLWSQDLQPAFPPEEFWFLYGKLN